MKKSVLVAASVLLGLAYGFLSAMAGPTLVGALPVATMSAPVVIDGNLTPGSTFSVNITIANVENLWGYQFALFYNTSVIDAIDYAFVDPRFTLDLPSEIGTHYVALARATYIKDLVGVTITDPTPMARIDFVVTGYGATSLHFDPDYTEMAGIVIAYNVSKGNLILADGSVTLFKWEYTFHDPGRGTTLKINTKLKFFEFTTPQKGYGIKQDPSMDVSHPTLRINYEDSEIRFHSVSINTRSMLCVAVAFDKISHTIYWLLQRP